MRGRTTQELVNELLEAGDSQADIARATGLTQPTICRLANGGHKNPSVDTHNKVAAYAARRLRKSKATA